MSPGPYILIDKPIGLTPLETLERLRAAVPALTHARLGYAGRLDPLACGLLVALVDEENKRQGHYFAMSKEYIVDILFGYATDTYDPLGLVTRTAPGFRPASHEVCTALAAFEGTRPQRCPPFSAARLRGKPLYYWARQGLLQDHERPAPLRTVHAATLIESRVEGADALGALIDARVSSVQGNFRQDEIRARWRSALADAGQQPCAIATVRVRCSGGTYMRALAHELGEALGGCALALGIARTRVGEFTLDRALRI